MKLVVVRNFQSPQDSLKKKGRYAVVLGMVGGRVVVAPCTSYPARTGTVPQGSALLTSESAAFAGTGFTVNQVAISVRDAALYSPDSYYVRRCVQVGILDIELDKRFGDNLSTLMKEYDLLHSKKYEK